MRNTGKAYINAAGKVMGSRCSKEISCRCQNRYKTITLEEQKAICNDFWSFGEHDQRTLFVISNIEEVPIKSPSTNSQTRTVSRKFYLPVVRSESSQRLKVSKDTFLKTLCIGNKTIQYNVDKVRQVKSHQDSHGKQASINKNI